MPSRGLLCARCVYQLVMITNLPIIFSNSSERPQNAPNPLAHCVLLTFHPAQALCTRGVSALACWPAVELTLLDHNRCGLQSESLWWNVHLQAHKLICRRCRPLYSCHTGQVHWVGEPPVPCHRSRATRSKPHRSPPIC